MFAKNRLAWRVSRKTKRASSAPVESPQTSRSAVFFQQFLRRYYACRRLDRLAATAAHEPRSTPLGIIEVRGGTFLDARQLACVSKSSSRKRARGWASLPRWRWAQRRWRRSRVRAIGELFFFIRSKSLSAFLSIYISLSLFVFPIWNVISHDSLHTRITLLRVLITFTDTVGNLIVGKKTC